MAVAVEVGQSLVHWVLVVLEGEELVGRQGQMQLRTPVAVVVDLERTTKAVGLEQVELSY